MTNLHLLPPGFGTKHPRATKGLLDPSIHPLFSEPGTFCFSACSADLLLGWG